MDKKVIVLETWIDDGIQHRLIVNNDGELDVQYAKPGKKNWRECYFYERHMVKFCSNYNNE